jgi:hypothetical protein
LLRLVRRRRRQKDDDEEHKEKMTSWCSLLVSFEQICESFVFGWVGKRLETSSSSIFSSLDPLCSSGLFVSVFGIGAAMSPPPGAQKGRKKEKYCFEFFGVWGRRK